MSELLKNIAKYSTERISLSDLDLSNYISTENLLQNKSGKTFAEKLPPSGNQVTKYSSGDILISNIRPYLKKLWFANNTGGSSADVLTLKVKETYDSKFVYYALFRDEFFDYMMSGAKGTKMPRGDKQQVLNFPIPKFDFTTQTQIAKVLSDLDAKIELNNKINAELEAMAKLIYDYWFVQFEFPCLPQDYRPSGQVNPNSLPQDYRPSGQVNPNFDLSEKIRSFCTYKQTGGLPLPDGRSWFVYVLLCNDGSFYKGMTNDLYRRYYEHGTGQGAHHTKVHKPVKVIHWEQFDTQEEAAMREKELKTGFGRTWLQREYEKLQKQQVKPGSPAHQNARLSKLMPAGKMVWNEELRREVPEGWEVKELIDIANITMGQSPPGESYNENNEGTIFYQGCTDFGKRFPTIRKYTTQPTRFAQINDILLSVRAPVGTMNIAKEECCIGRGLAALNSKDDCMPYLFGVMSNLKQIFDRRNTDGTTFGAITKDDLFSIKVISPSNELIKRFDKIVGPMFKEQNMNELQNIELAELRDWLLPMLMNGQVQVEGNYGGEEQVNMAAEASVGYGKGE